MFNGTILFDNFSWSAFPQRPIKMKNNGEKTALACDLAIAHKFTSKLLYGILVSTSEHRAML